MSRVYILSGARTPVAVMDGSLRDYSESKLGAASMKLALELSGFGAGALSEIIVGAAKQTSKPSNLARYAMLDARLPIHVPAYTVHRQSASGIQAVANGVWSIKSGMAGAVLAGGCESMTHIPREIHNARNSFNEHTRIIFDPIGAQIEGAQPEKLSSSDICGRIAEKHGITTEEAASFAAACAGKAAARAAADYICKLQVRKSKAVESLETDEISPKPEIVAKPADGAAMLVLASEEAASDKKPIAEVFSIAAAAGNPAYGLAETCAVKKALEKADMALPGLARIEIVEMSAVQVLATIKGLGLEASDKRINPLGGGLALGSPWGASGTVHLVDLIHGLKSGESGIVVNPAEGGQVMCVVVRKM